MIGVGSDGLLKIPLSKISATPNYYNTDVKYIVRIHTPNEVINVDLLVTIMMKRDYSKSLTDELYIECYIPMGVFIKRLYPYRENIEISIERYWKTGSYIRKYKALLQNGLDKLSGNYRDTLSEENLNKLEMSISRFQCIDKCYESMKNFNISNVYNNTDVKSIMYNEFYTVLNNIKTASMDISKMGIDISEPDNKSIYKNTIIPFDTKILDLPSFLHEKEYGVYNSLIGTYIQYYGNSSIPNLYVYPVYDEYRVREVPKKLVIYNSNVAMYDMSRNTYMVDGDLLNIIANSNTDSLNNVANSIIDEGVGIASSRVENLTNINAYPTDDGVYYDRNKNMSFDKAYSVRDNNDKYKYVGYKNNLFTERGNVVARRFQIMKFEWNFCELDLIYPGMPVMFIFVSVQLGMVKMTGTVLSTAMVYNKANNNTVGFIVVAVKRA